MRKTLLLPLALLLFITCQKDEHSQQAPSQPNNLHPKTFKTTDDVFSFLGQEMPEVYTPAEISRLKSMLEQPKTDDFKRSGNTVELPAGSVDALQAAVDEAGPGGTVIVKSGDHMETGLVSINHPIRILGENGATITLTNPTITEFPTIFSGGLHLNNAAKSWIKNIDFVASSSGAGSAILVEESDRTVIMNNSFTNIQYAITVATSDRTTIRKNRIMGDPNLILAPENLGITMVSGSGSSVTGNYVTGMTFGIWCCEKGGVNWGNETNGNFYGQILCRVPEGGYVGPNGNGIFAGDSGNRWLVALNKSSNNLYGGIVVIDGAHDNTLLANSGSGNGAYDVDLVGDTERFGFFTPTSVKNRIYSYNDQVIKDCGEDNKVIGGNLVDTSIDPCDNVE
jgi:parallel beta-helix repeat protein